MYGNKAAVALNQERYGTYPVQIILESTSGYELHYWAWFKKIIFTVWCRKYNADEGIFCEAICVLFLCKIAWQHSVKQII